MQFDFNQLNQFKNIIWNYYAQQGRVFVWRHVDDPYWVVISEVMLQQTQTHRVEPKFAHWLELFPTFESLAAASLKEVLTAWQGLGYNRRAKFLHALAQAVVHNYNGILPSNPQELQKLPGIGPATASSICAFAFNKPTIFIETNIRTVFIHFFFGDRTDVHDKELIPLIQATVCEKSPRDWYYALMDYGVFLKKQLPNPSRQSKHHTKQSKFEGSDRQIRGAVVRLLTKQECMAIADLHELLQNKYKADPQRVAGIIVQMLDEKLLNKNSECYFL